MRGRKIIAGLLSVMLVLAAVFAGNVTSVKADDTKQITINVTDSGSVLDTYYNSGIKVDGNWVEDGKVNVPITNATHEIVFTVQFGCSVSKVLLGGVEQTILTRTNGEFEETYIVVDDVSSNTYDLTFVKAESDDITIIWNYNDPSVADAYVSNGKVEVVSITRAGQIIYNASTPNENVRIDNNGGWVALKKGDNVVVKLVPDFGYQVGDVSVNEQKLVADSSNESVFKLDNIQGNLHFSGRFVQKATEITGLQDYQSTTIANGQNAITSGSLRLSVNSGGEPPVVTDVVEGATSVTTLELGLTKVLSQGTVSGVSQGEWTTPISEFTNNITVTIPITDTTGLSDGQTYGIVRNHNGQKEELRATYNASAKTLTFLTNKFSEYTIIKRDVATAPTIPVAPTTPTTPPDTPSEKTESSSSTTNSSATNTTVSTTVGTVTDVTKSTENFQGATLGEPPAELLANVLTAAEQALVASGVEVMVWIDAKDISATVPAEQQALVVNSLPEKYEVAKYLDINLYKQVGNNASTKVTQLPNGNVAIRFVLPEDLRKDGRQYKVVRIHDGAVTVLDATFDPATGFISFETNQFSAYAIIYTDSATNTKSPKTNNGVDFGAMLAVLLLCASSVYMVNRRKRA